MAQVASRLTTRSQAPASSPKPTDSQTCAQIDDLLKERNEIHASYTTALPMKRSSSGSSGSNGQKQKCIKGGERRWPPKAVFKGSSKEEEMVQYSCKG
ncbi:hypothetical protein Tco_0273086 [Tanacetum coccineum]